MEQFYSVILGILAFSVVFGIVLNINDEGISGYAIKTLHKPELNAPVAWVERRYICDLPNRNDCIDCCESVRRFTKGPAVLMDYESCIVKMPKRKVEDASHVWEDCIRVVSGLKPKYGLVEIVEEPEVSETPAEMPIVPKVPTIPPASLPSLPEPAMQPSPQPVVEQPQSLPVQTQPYIQQPGTLAHYKICSLLRKKPERPLLFLPFHPLMVASIVC